MPLLARLLFSRLVVLLTTSLEIPPPAQRGIILLRDRGTRRRATAAPLLLPETLALPLPYVEDDDDEVGGLACTPARV